MVLCASWDSVCVQFSAMHAHHAGHAGQRAMYVPVHWSPVAIVEVELGLGLKEKGRKAQASTAALVQPRGWLPVEHLLQRRVRRTRGGIR